MARIIQLTVPSGEYYGTEKEEPIFINVDEISSVKPDSPDMIHKSIVSMNNGTEHLVMEDVNEINNRIKSPG